MTPVIAMPAARGAAHASLGVGRLALIGFLAFLTVVDLFATQALLPALAGAYGVAPSAMGTAVNASTLGMAVAGLAVARFGRGTDRRRGTAASLALLALPTALLAVAPDLTTFAALRVVQGLCMATAFSLSLAAISASGSASATATAVSAYITGNVASNMLGRLMSASLAHEIGVGASFYIFTLLNLVGAALALNVLARPGRDPAEGPGQHRGGLAQTLADRRLRASLIVGFCILFAFISTFSYVNFVLVAPPLSLGMMSVGLVYLVFLPSILTTPLAGALVSRIGTRKALLIGLGTALLGLPFLLAPSLPAVLAGLALFSIGTFLAQATTTGFVGRAARGDGGSASGLYLAAYFLGGIVGSAILGRVFDLSGWTPTVAGVAAALVVAAYFSTRLSAPDPGLR